MIELIIFDFDGTLVDSSKDIIRTTNELLKIHGLKQLKEEEILPHISHGFSGLISQQFGRDLNDPSLIKLLEVDFAKIYHNYYLENITLMPGTMDILGNWCGKKAIVTNKPERDAKAIVESSPLGQHDWVTIYGRDTFEHRKPHPLPLLKTLDEAGIPPEKAVMVGDGLPDIEAAHQAGMHSVAIDFGFTPKDFLKKARPDHIISNYSDLLPLIKTLN